MGKKEKRLIRVVLDTNVLVSSLLFQGKLARLVDFWKDRRIIPLMSRETFNELVRVLSYPKFSLTPEEIKTLLENEIIPFFEVVEPETADPIGCRDPEDEKFLACAIHGSADFLVTGDKDLFAPKTRISVTIVTPADILKRLSRR